MKKIDLNADAAKAQTVPLGGSITTIVGDLFQDAATMFASLPPVSPQRAIYDLHSKLLKAHEADPCAYLEETKRFNDVLRRFKRRADKNKHSDLATYARRALTFWNQKQDGVQPYTIEQKKIGIGFDYHIKMLDEYIERSYEVSKPEALTYEVSALKAPTRDILVIAEVEVEPETHELVGSTQIDLRDYNGAHKTLKQIEEEAVLATLRECKGSRNEAMRRLDISRGTFYRNYGNALRQIKVCDKN